MTSKLKLGCFLVVATLTTVCAYAQVEPLSPNLSAPLTADPETAPITTLAVDLLAPQRPYIFDPSGASIIANALNPAIYSSSFNSSLVQTDTQVRDSSQTGHLSPYGAAASRLGLSSSGGDAAANEETPRISTGSFRGAIPGGNGDQDFGADTDSAYQSSWGTSSSFGAQSDESSWGTKRLGVNRLGRKQPESYTASQGLNGQEITASNTTGSSAHSIGSASERSTGYPGGYSIGPYGGRSTGSSGGYSIGSVAGGSSGNSTDTFTRQYRGSSLTTSGYAAIGSRTRHSFSESTPGEVVPVDTTTDTTNGQAGGATNGTAKDKTKSAENVLTFFPLAAYSQSPLGESPFSSPGGVDELHFLNPNILAATSRGRSLSPTEAANAGPTQDSLRQAFVRRHTLATSTSRYGLAKHPAGNGLKTGIGEKSTLQKRTHLNTGISDLDNP